MTTTEFKGGLPELLELINTSGKLCKVLVQDIGKGVKRKELKAFKFTDSPVYFTANYFEPDRSFSCCLQVPNTDILAVVVQYNHTLDNVKPIDKPLNLWGIEKNYWVLAYAKYLKATDVVSRLEPIWLAYKADQARERAEKERQEQAEQIERENAHKASVEAELVANLTDIANNGGTLLGDELVSLIKRFEIDVPLRSLGSLKNSQTNINADGSYTLYGVKTRGKSGYYFPNLSNCHEYVKAVIDAIRKQYRLVREPVNPDGQVTNEVMTETEQTQVHEVEQLPAVQAKQLPAIKQGELINRLAFIKAVKEAKAFTGKSTPETEQVHVLRTSNGYSLFASDFYSSIKIGSFPIEVIADAGWLRFGFDAGILMQSAALLNGFSMTIIEQGAINAYFVSDNGTFKVATEQYQYQLGYWPSDIQIAATDVFTIDTTLLKGLARLNSKQDDIRDIIGTVFLTIDQDGLKGAMTTNGHFLLQDGLFEHEGSLGVSSQDLLKLPDGDLDCQIVDNDGQKYLFVTAGAGQYLIKIKDVKCPVCDLDTVAPNRNELPTLDLPAHFLKTVKLVGNYVNKTTKAIKCTVADGQVSLSGFDPYYANDCEISLCSTDIDQAGFFVLHADMLAQVVKGIKDVTDEPITAGLPIINLVTPIVFTAGSLYALLMPLEPESYTTEIWKEPEPETDYQDDDFNPDSLTDEA